MPLRRASPACGRFCFAAAAHSFLHPYAVCAGYSQGARLCTACSPCPLPAAPQAACILQTLGCVTPSLGLPELQRLFTPLNSLLPANIFPGPCSSHPSHFTVDTSSSLASAHKPLPNHTCLVRPPPA